MKKHSNIIKFDNFPFNIGAQEKKYKKIPGRLPFYLTYEKNLSLITQKSSPRQKEALRKYYLLGGYASTPLGEGSFGDRRATWTLDFIKKSLNSNKRTYRQLSFLEIGCGTGYLLNLIKKEGAKVVWGLEPGEKGAKTSKKYGLKIINDFFPSKKIDRKFDYIFSHCVLEHMENPRKALLAMKKLLNPNGIIFVVVPACEDKMSVGDISILSHQHINYFTKNSLRGLLKSIGLSIVSVVSSKKIAMLYGWGEKTDSKKSTKINNIGADAKLMKRFIVNFNKNIQTIQKLVYDYETQNKEIGLYGECGILRGLLKFNNEPRVFDGDSAKWGKYMLCSQNRFESPIQLVKKPVDVLLITPIDYDREIRDNFKKIGLNDRITEIISLKDIYEKNSGRKYTRSSSTSGR